jgi:small subunit ribosomal protein S15
MARRYSGKKGKSGSTKPSKIAAPTWLRYKPKEIELLITKLAKEGKNAAEIGMVLRDSYGVPSVKLVTKKRISKILEEKGLNPKIPDDLTAIIKRFVKLKKHFEANRQDMSSKRGILLAESQIRRLVKYYKGTGKLPLEWKYDAESMKLYVE